MARDEKINEAHSEGGDPTLCEAAIKAVKIAHIPAPENDAVYEVFKHASLSFSF